MTDDYEVANLAYLSEVRRRKGWRAPEHTPEQQAEINGRGLALLRDSLERVGVKPKARGVDTTTCPTHPDERGGTTPAGDPWCGECRRAHRTTPTTEEN